MTSKKAFSIISIACFISVIFIPIGIVLMIFYTQWNKKAKFLLSVILSFAYVFLVIFLINLSPSPNSKGLEFSYPVSKDFSDVEKSSHKETEELELPENHLENSKNTKNKSDDSQNSQGKLPKSLSRQKGNIFQSRYFYILCFMLFMLFLIIRQNINSQKKKDYENPYVDTSKYQLPLNIGSKLPMVHFQKIKLFPQEIIYFATETTKKEDEGDFVVTNKRVVVLSKSGDYEFPMNALTAVSSVSNTVMLLTCGERKYYIFFPEGQIKYALAITRWAYSKYENS